MQHWNSGDNACAVPDETEALQHARQPVAQDALPELHLCHDELFQIDIIAECHSASVNAKNPPLCFGVREGKFNFPVNSARPDQGWI